MASERCGCALMVQHSVHPAQTHLYKPQFGGEDDFGGTLTVCVCRANTLYGTEEALYSSRNGIMGMRGWKLKPENSNMK